MAGVIGTQLSQASPASLRIVPRCRTQTRCSQSSSGDLARVHACPPSTGDVPDDPEARLVILGPEYPHVAKSPDSPARKQIVTILDHRGSSPRENKNALVFLAADRTRLGELDQA